MDRLYVVVRADLPAGAQIAQSCHAVSAFAYQYPEEHAAWQAADQNLVALSIEHEEALTELLRRATNAGIRCVGFREPWLGDQLTACAFSGEVAKLVASLPLALKAPRAA